jgi:hypothetical protein
MIGQYLPQTNESATFPKTFQFSELNKACGRICSGGRGPRPVPAKTADLTADKLRRTCVSDRALFSSAPRTPIPQVGWVVYLRCARHALAIGQ